MCILWLSLIPYHVLKILYMGYNFFLVFSWYFHLQYAADINLNDIFLRGASYARSCFSHTYKESSSFLQEINRYYHEAYRFRKAIRRQYIPDTDRPDVFFLGGSVSRSSIAIPYNQFKFFISSTQKFHHKVQVFLHDALESNRYSRCLANEPVTFILAYLLVVSPMWIAWFLYSTRFGSKKWQLFWMTRHVQLWVLFFFCVNGIEVWDEKIYCISVSL